MTAWLIYLAVGAVGATSVITQLALLREMLGAFSGNELTLGIMLGNWLLLTGLGAWLGRNTGKRQNSFSVGLILLAGLPLAQVVLLRVFRNVVFLPGATLGVVETFAGSFVVLLPFCLVSGYLLTLACGLTGNIGGVYVADSLGSVAGGMVFSFVLVRWFDHFTILCWPAILCLALAAWLNRKVIPVAVLGAAAMGAALWWNVDARSTARQFPGQNVVFTGNSPYGKLVVTENAWQFNFIENGLPVFTTHDTERIEETAHFAMAQWPDAQRVLLIGGGVTGTAREILKYAVRELTYIELDPLIIEAGQRFMPAALADRRVRVVNTDGRRFVKETSEQFDVVIVDLPDPTTAQLNRFFTAEFFAAVRRVLPADGVVVFGLGRYENYVSPELARLLASAYRTVHEVFPNVLALPGGRVFFVASAAELTRDIAGRLEEHRIQTQWMKRHALDAMLTPDRLADVQRAVTAPANVNRDFAPVLYFYQLRHWLSQFPVRFGLLEAGLVVALGIYLVRLRPSALVIFAGGFAASALEVMLLLAMQIACGALYRQLGVVVAAFMAGLAVGAWITGCHPERSEGSQSLARAETTEICRELRLVRLGFRCAQNDKYRLAGLAFVIAGLAAVLPVVLQHAGHAPVIVALTFILAAVVGMEFPVASRVDGGASAATAGRLYAADLIGACLGAWLASTLLIPVLGVPVTCGLTAALNVAAGLVMWRRKI